MQNHKMTKSFLCKTPLDFSCWKLNNIAVFLLEYQSISKHFVREVHHLGYLVEEAGWNCTQVSIQGFSMISDGMIGTRASPLFLALLLVWLNWYRLILSSAAADPPEYELLPLLLLRETSDNMVLQSRWIGKNLTKNLQARWCHKTWLNQLTATQELTLMYSCIFTP